MTRDTTGCHLSLGMAVFAPLFKELQVREAIMSNQYLCMKAKLNGRKTNIKRPLIIRTNDLFRHFST